MLFDHRAPLPVARMLSRSRATSPWASFVLARSAVVTSQLRGARLASWRWLRPRTVPVLVALTGMFAVLGSAEYLSRLARQTPEHVTAPIEQLAVHAPLAIDSESGVLRIEQGPPGATIELDRSFGRVLQLPAGCGQLHVQLVPLVE